MDDYPIDERGLTRTPGAARHLGMSESWLNKARHFGGGPDFVKIGSAVMYSYVVLDRFAAKRRRNCTRDDGAEAA